MNEDKPIHPVPSPFPGLWYVTKQRDDGSWWADHASFGSRRFAEGYFACATGYYPSPAMRLVSGLNEIMEEQSPKSTPKVDYRG